MSQTVTVCVNLSSLHQGDSSPRSPLQVLPVPEKYVLLRHPKYHQTRLVDRHKLRDHAALLLGSLRKRSEGLDLDHRRRVLPGIFSGSGSQLGGCSSGGGGQGEVSQVGAVGGFADPLGDLQIQRVPATKLM